MGPVGWGCRNSAMDLFTVHFLYSAECKCLVQFESSLLSHCSIICCILSKWEDAAGLPRGGGGVGVQ